MSKKDPYPNMPDTQGSLPKWFAISIAGIIALVILGGIISAVLS